MSVSPTYTLAHARSLTNNQMSAARFYGAVAHTLSLTLCLYRSHSVAHTVPLSLTLCRSHCASVAHTLSLTLCLYRQAVYCFVIIGTHTAPAALTLHHPHSHCTIRTHTAPSALTLHLQAAASALWLGSRVESFGSESASVSLFFSDVDFWVKGGDR